MRIKTIPAGFLGMAMLCLQAFSQNAPLAAEKLFTIGPGTAKGPYLLLNVDDLRTDASGNIYVLDSRRAKIVKFSPAGEFMSTIGRPVFEVENSSQERNYLKDRDLKAKLTASRTTGDLYSPRALHIDDKSILVADTGKLVLFDLLGNVMRVVTTKGMSLLYGAFPNDRGELTVLGSAADDSLFHVLDGEGNPVRSYGDRFAVPPEIKDKWSGDTKDSKIKMASMPISYFIGSAGESLLIDPFKYEISIFRGERLWETLTGPSPYSSGFVGVSESHIDGKRAGLITGSIARPMIFETNGLILVFHAKDGGNVGSGNPRIFRVDVFKAYRFAKSFDLALEGYPGYVDTEGRLFTIGSHLNPFVNAYAIWPLLN